MKEVLQKYIYEKCSVEEFKKAVTALAGLIRQGTLNDFMHKHWSEYEEEKFRGNSVRFSQILDHIHHEINLSEEKVPVLRKLFHVFSRVAAILLLPLVVMLVLDVNNNSGKEQMSMTRMATPAGMQSQIELPDGSLVWLNSESEIYFSSTFKGQKQRVVKLVGEGYFQVASDKRKPFIVSVEDGLEVRVTGTSFNLSAYKNEPQVSIALVEGSVTINRKIEDVNSCVEMNPGEVGYYNKVTQKISVSNKMDLEPYIAWKDGKYMFENALFEAVLRTMERKYNVKYVIDDPDLLKYRITATFFDETLDEFLNIITTSSPIAYKIERPKKEGNANMYEKRIVILTKK